MSDDVTRLLGAAAAMTLLMVEAPAPRVFHTPPSGPVREIGDRLVLEVRALVQRGLAKLGTDPVTVLVDGQKVTAVRVMPTEVGARLLGALRWIARCAA